MSKSKKKLWLGVGFAVVLVLLAVFLCTGESGRMLHELVVTHNADDDWEEIFDFGREGMLGITLLSMFQVILLFIPAEPIQVLAGLSYGFGWGVALCMIGVIVGILAMADDLFEEPIAAIGVLVGGFCVAYISALFLAAFGELVETNTPIKESNDAILAKLNEPKI